MPYPKLPSARSRYPISSERTGPDPSSHTARLAVMHCVRPQKSAEAIVVFQCFTMVAEHEGQNLRSRAEQWAARYSTKTRPGQSSASQAQAAGLVRILCVAREGAYETLHEPPTADPHGGWCGGWELETPGYPISVVIGQVPKIAHQKQAVHKFQLSSLATLLVFLKRFHCATLRARIDESTSPCLNQRSIT